ncbi:MAG: hypothetical protein IPP49_15585, partial [Saprospiraceae bacterium]|nr:hypothetical protein [Saprospiraceae bacterium]
MKYQSLILICFIYITTGCNKRQEASIYSPVNLGIIPAPNNVHTSGASSQLKELKIALRNDMNQDSYLQWVGDVKGISFLQGSGANVSLIDFKGLEREGYRLDIQKEKIEISAGSSTGFQYGLTT